MSVKTRRFEDIVAFQEAPQKPIVAFHARNMEVAQVSEEIWNLMAPYDLRAFHFPTKKGENGAFPSDAQEALSDWSREEDDSLRSGKLPLHISRLTLNVNQICNLKCSYCFASGDGTYGEPMSKISVEKTVPQLRYFLDRLHDGDTFSIKFIGGEPLLYSDGMAAISEYVDSYIQQAGEKRNLKSRFAITTNGTLFTPENLKLLKKMKAEISISCDGPPEINDVVRPMKNGKSSTQAIIDGLRLLGDQADGLGSIGIYGVFSRNNMNLLKAYEFYRQFPVLQWYDFGFDATETDPTVNEAYYKAMGDVMDRAFQVGGASELLKIQSVSNYFELLDARERLEHHCGAARRFLAVDAKNRLYPCALMISEKKEILGEGAQIDQPKLENFQGSLIEQHGCQTCWARYLCGGGCMYVNNATNGDLHKKSQAFCERTRAIIQKSLSYYQLVRNS